jgi:hypothetical protein
VDRLIVKELSNFVLVWRILGPTLLLMCLGMVFFSWPDRWLTWFLFFLSLLFGFFTLKHTQMAKRSLQLVKYGQPENCAVEIRKETGDSRDYYKGIVSQSNSGKKWDILFTPPGWNVDPLFQKHLQAKAYFESETEYPLVVVTDEGYLWAERNPVRVNTSAKSG